MDDRERWETEVNPLVRSGPLSIAMFSDSAYPILNGVSVSIDALIRELRARGHSVFLFTSSAPGFKDPDANTYRFPAIETPWTKGYPLAYPPFYPMLRKFRRHQFDIIHTHTPWTLGFVGLRWAESHGLPIVSTYHTQYDRYAHYIPYFPRRYVRFKIAKHTHWYYNRVGQVIAPSEAAMKWLRRHSVETPGRVIPTGAPSVNFLERAECRARLGIRPDQKLLLYVGRLAKEKNLDTLLEAAAEVLRNDRSTVFWLVGDGPYRAECVAHARRLGIGDRVRFVGFVPRLEVDPYYAAADLFVFASVTETQGLVVQEAATYGLPAVVVGAGGAGEAIEHGVNGFSVRNDARELADATLRILRDDALHAQMSQEAIRAVRGFGAEQMADQVLQVYHDAIESGHHQVEPHVYSRL